MEVKNFKNHFVYWILPVLVMLPCILIFFYNPNGFAKFIAPEFNREFGIIENLQLVLLAVIFTLALRGIKRKTLKVEKYGFKLLAFAAVFFFLEEIDYGLHYYEFMIGKTKAQVDYQIVVEHQVRNIHNIGKMNSVIKFLVYLCTAILFVLLPLLPKKIIRRYPWVDYFAPSGFFIGTAIALLLLNQVVSYLNTIFYEQNIALAGNVSEFEEVMNYYIFLLYIKEMVNKQQTAPVQKWNIAHLCGLGTKPRINHDIADTNLHK